MPSPQQPIDSPFGMRSTALQVVDGVDLTDKTAIVTGGYSGIGTETVRALATAGARVIVGARRPDTASDVLADMPGSVDILPLDLAEPASIDTFAAAAGERLERLDVLVNNAAVMACPLRRDDRGHEWQFATNHLGHFALTARLWPLLRDNPGARIVALSSIGHRLNGLDIDDLQFENREYNKWLAYGQAKSANALFALQLDKVGEAHGVRAFAVHPGGIATPLQRHLTMEEQVAMGWYDDEGNVHPGFKSVAEGASTTVWCATSPLLDGLGGVYCEDCNIARAVAADEGGFSGAFPHIRDAALAAALWERSESLTGIRFS